MMDFPFPWNEWRKSIQYVITFRRHHHMVVKEFNMQPVMFVGSANVRGNICLFTMEGEPPYIVLHESHGNVSWCKRARHARTRTRTHANWCRTNDTCMHKQPQPTRHSPFTSHTYAHAHTHTHVHKHTLRPKKHTKICLPIIYTQTHTNTPKPTQRRTNPLTFRRLYGLFNGCMRLTHNISYSLLTAWVQFLSAGGLWRWLRNEGVSGRSW